LSKRIENKPLFVSDELPHYESAILDTYHTIKEFPKTGKVGRPKKPIKVVDPEINYAVVHKTREKGIVTKVEKRIVFGNEQSVKEQLEKSPSKTINTSYIERSNGTLRKNDSHLQRKTLKFAKEMVFFVARLAIIIVHYNFIKIHSTISKNPDKSITERTPALAAGIINENWTFKFMLERPEIQSTKI